MTWATAASGDAGAAGDPVLDLLRSIARDIAHELRGPVQAVVVNAEVARRKLATGDAPAVAERIDIVEAEVRRLHGMTDAFLSLIRPASLERRMTGVDAALAPLEPLLDALARSARTGLRREAEGDDALVRVRPQPFALAITAIVVAQCAAAGTRGEVTLLRRTTADSVDVIVRATSAPAPAPAPAAPAAANASASAPATRTIHSWLAPDGGTVEALPGSDPGQPGAVRIRLPRADIA